MKPNDSLQAYLDAHPNLKAPEDRGVQVRERTVPLHTLLAAARSARLAGQEVGTSQVRDAAPTSFQGQSLEVEFDDPLGSSGLPWHTGRLRLETRPDLEPLYARGRRGSPGEYQQLYRANPWLQSRLREIVAPVASAPWGLSHDDNAPEHQRAFQDACFRAWTERGVKWGLSKWIETHLRTQLVAGFAWAEIVWPAGREVPPLPIYRDPASVDQWILWGDEPLGLVQSTMSTDSFGASTPTNVVIPWEKILHSATEPAGPTDLEGRSLLRPAFTPLRLCEDCLTVQGLSVALNAAGTWVVTADRDAPRLDDPIVSQLKTHFQSYQAQHVPYLILPPGYKAELHSPDAAVVDVTAQIRLAEHAAMVAMSGAHGLVGAYGDGSRAARETASADARDLLDLYAGEVAALLEQLLRRLLLIRFPGEAPYPAQVVYANVETRLPGDHISTLATYLNDVRPKLWPAARAMTDALLDLPKEETVDQGSPALQEQPAENGS